MTSFFTRVQPSRTSLPVKQHEEMEWDEQDVMSVKEVDPHDWLKMKKSRDRAREKEDSLRVLVTLASV